MRIALASGRNFNQNDAYPHQAIVNQAFARTYFGGANPVGRIFSFGRGGQPVEVVGLVGDLRYKTIRETPTPQAYFPFRSEEQPLRDGGVFMQRTTFANPSTLAETVRRAVAEARPGFRASNI